MKGAELEVSQKILSVPCAVCLKHLIRYDSSGNWQQGRQRLPGDMPDCVSCPKTVHAAALSPELLSFRTLFFACHDVQGNQISWPRGGGLSDQSSEIAFAFIRMRQWMSSRMETEMKRSVASAQSKGPGTRGMPGERMRHGGRI